MQLIGFLLGIISIIGMFIFFLPLLGALNWINIPIALLGLVLSTLAVIPAQNKGLGIAGIILCSIAIVVGLGRLSLGCGIL